ncbi:MAG: acyl carrier protein [Ruminococcus sp.]|nr:acyl carrier protein [Ruminococcus sp.]MCD7959137.1 acyl carrier protein [Ruminococcus sp.]
MLDKMKELILQYVDVTPDEIVPEARFIEDLKFNSYDFMSFLGEMEDTLGVTVDEQDILELHTVGQAITYLENLQKSGE